jgi:hypothetical protein
VGVTVVVIEADLRRPTLSALFGVEAGHWRAGARAVGGIQNRRLKDSLVNVDRCQHDASRRVDG